MSIETEGVADQLQADILENNLATQHPYHGFPPYCIHCKWECRGSIHALNHSQRCIWYMAYKRRTRGEFTHLEALK
jgi:hypothetical protein